MKRTIAILIAVLIITVSKAQVMCTFENFSLNANSFYKDTNNLPFVENTASFEYEWTKGAFPYWSGGFSYTNHYDSSTAGFTNIYGVKPLHGYNGSNIFVIAKHEGMITLTAPQTTVEGFYITNTTYAYEAIKQGDAFCRKFGDTTGTGSGTTIAQGSYPDFFKVVIRGYLNGNLKTDSVEYYLADYRFANNAQDYVVKTWEYVNTSSLGTVDSIRFFLRSSDVGQFGMNTPAFFGMDNFTLRLAGPVGINEQTPEFSASVYPNPFYDKLNINVLSFNNEPVTLTIKDVSGQLIYTETLRTSHAEVPLDGLSAGYYLVEFSTMLTRRTLPLVKQ